MRERGRDRAGRERRERDGERERGTADLITGQSHNQVNTLTGGQCRILSTHNLIIPVTKCTRLYCQQ